MCKLDIKWNKMVPELTVSDLSKSLNFYVDILGFEIVYQRNNPNFAYLDMSGVQIMLEEKHNSGWYTGDLVIPFGRGVNFQMEILDISIITSNLEFNKIDLYRPLQESIYDTNEGKVLQKELLVKDPDGYLLRFTEIVTHA